MTNPAVLDALATAYVDNLNALLNAEANVVNLATLDDLLQELDPEWRENIDPDLNVLVELAEDDLHDLRASLPPAIRATEQYAARATANGGIYDFFGFFDNAEDVQAAIDMTGRPQNFEVVRRLNTEWVKA